MKKRGPRSYVPATTENLAKKAPLSPEMLALRGHLANPRLTDMQIKFLYHYTHPHSKGRGVYMRAMRSAGYTAFASHGERIDWVKSEEAVALINKSVMYWTEVLGDRTAMDNINDRLYKIAMFDVGTTVRKRQDGFLEVQDFTKIDTSALEEIFVDTTRKETTDKDGNVTVSITNQKVRVKAYNAMAGAKLFAHIKGELNQNKFGNTDTPHKLIINGVRGTKVVVEMGDGKEAPIEVNATPAPAKAADGPTEEGRESAAGAEFGASPD